MSTNLQKYVTVAATSSSRSSGDKDPWDKHVMSVTNLQKYVTIAATSSSRSSGDKDPWDKHVMSVLTTCLAIIHNCKSKMSTSSGLLTRPPFTVTSI